MHAYRGRGEGEFSARKSDEKRGGARATYRGSGCCLSVINNLNGLSSASLPSNHASTASSSVSTELNRSFQKFHPIWISEVLPPSVTTLSTYAKDINHALHLLDSFRFDATDDGHRSPFTMDVKYLYTVISNDCRLQALTYFLDERGIKEPSTYTITRLAELVLTLNSFSFNNE